MLSFDDALQCILDHTAVSPVQHVPLLESLGSVLAEPLISPFDMPRFDNSAMDGYGVKLGDLLNASQSTPAKLTVTGTLQAGSDQLPELQKGTAIKIMTGAPVPPSVDAVVMKEFCETKNGHVLVKCTAEASENIRKKGEEFSHGQQILPAGTPITPAVIGLLATLGYAQVPVHTQPRIGIIATGNELVEPGKPLKNGQIYDSNRYALEAACRNLGINQITTACAKDDVDSLRKTIGKMLQQTDALITLGGVSVGDYDFVKDVLEHLGVETKFWKINIKPGKPVLFGITADRKPVFGLPGNPVSALVTFHLFVRPALLKMGGHPHPKPKTQPATLLKKLRQKPGRRTFVRGILDQTGVTPTEGQDSHMMLGLAKANALIVFPEDQSELPEGGTVQILPLTAGV